MVVVRFLELRNDILRCYVNDVLAFAMISERGHVGPFEWLLHGCLECSCVGCGAVT